MLRTIVIVFSILLIISCSGNKNQEKQQNTQAVGIKVEKKDSVKQELPDYWGTYRGTIPATGDKKIKISITLKRDSTFRMDTELIGNKDHHSTYEGQYSVSDNIISINIKDELPKYFMIEKNKSCINFK